MTGSLDKLPSSAWLRMVPVLVAGLICFSASRTAAADVAAAKPLKDWYSLSAAEAQKGWPVEVEGTVLCYDLGWRQFYLHDGANAAYLNPEYFTNRFRVGQYVKLTATTTWGGSAPALTNTSAAVSADRPLPEPARLKLAELAKFHGQWVEIRGQVRVADNSRGRVALIIQDGDQKCLVYVMQTSGATPFKDLVDTGVEIQGINNSRIENGRLVGAIVFAPEMSTVKVITPRRIDRWQLPVLAIDALLTRPLGDWTNLPVHVNGLVSAYEPGSSLTIKDPTGFLNAEVIQVNQTSLYQRVDAWGFLSVTTNHVVLRDAYFELTGGSSGEGGLVAKSRPTNSIGPVLTNISQIRSLSKEKAGENLPARVRGVLTCVDFEWRSVFLQDGHDAIFLDTSQSDLRPGQWVEVTGRTEGSGFAPELVDCSIKILGMTNLPGAGKIDLQDAANGQLDSQWVQLEGVVRRVNKEGGRISLSLASPYGQFNAIVMDFNPRPVAAGLIDSYVSVRGACGSVVNGRGQLSGIMLHVPSRDEITIIDSSPPDPFTIGATPVSSVGTFNPRQVAGRRLKVAGTVTLVAPDRTLFLQDDSGGIRIQGAQTDQVHAGDVIEALGFPALFEFSPCLQEAVIRRIGGGGLPAAIRTTATQILGSGKFDGSIVELEATVLQSLTGAARPKLVLQNGPIIFTAQVLQPDIKKLMPALSPGSLVSVRGVCAIQDDENHEPAAFHVLLADPRGVRLLKGAPWWTVRHTIMLVGGIILGVLLASSWVRSLRRQVSAQTKIIRQNQSELLEISREAGMAEVATSVLHNVGNVLNSINVAASLAEERIKKSSVNDLRRVSKLIDEHAGDRAAFFTSDPKGRKVPEFLGRLAENLGSEQAAVLGELASLRGNVDHVKEIIAMQQSYARMSGVLENIEVCELLEDTLRMNTDSLANHQVRVVRDYSRLPPICTDKHKVLQILVNLVRNAKYACDESGRSDKQMILRATNGGDRVRIAVIDNGVGIPPENLTRIFNHGFTTRKDGHGFGLHSGALAARELGGSLTVQSDGPGRGAAFTLELPCRYRPDSDTTILKNRRNAGPSAPK